MRPRTPCPDLTRLRLFLCEPSLTLETDGVRAHLAQCAICRTLLAGLEAKEGPAATLAFEDEAPAVASREGANGHSPARSKTEGMRISVPVDEAGLDATIADDAPTLPSLALFSGADSSGADASAETCGFDSKGDSNPPSGFDAATLASTEGDGPDQSPPLSTPRRGVLEGVTVPGYDILGELGRGGMGVVYKARDQRLHRLVALKMVLAGAHVGEVGLARFRAEAEAVAKLTHANIVQIYETGEHEGRPFFSLEYVEGGSLDHRLSEGPSSPKSAAQFVETLAHGRWRWPTRAGVVHRDLKPANILLAKMGSQSSLVRGRESDSSSHNGEHWSRNSVPKIADFGLAKRTDDASNQTQTGAILGTPSYMAPEQAGGKNREIGPATDIYALGAILYELLVGRPPFKAGNPIDTVRQVVEQEPVPPRQLEPRVPLDLETICLKCLEKEPARRFATSADLADDLRRFVEGSPIHSRPTPAWERVWKWCRRRPAIVSLLAVCVAATLSMVLLIVWHNVSLRGRLDVALTKERQARLRERNAVAERHLAVVRQEGQKLFDGARVSVAAGDWPNARLLLEKALTTIGGEAQLDNLKDSAQTLLQQVEHELSVETDRRASLARLEKFGRLRDEAQFLGTLYTGMDLASNLEAARASGA